MSDLKPKKLCREDVIPGCVYGKHFNPSLLIQVTEKEVKTFLRTNSADSAVILSYGEKIGDQITLTVIPKLNNEHIDLLFTLNSLVVEVKKNLITFFFYIFG